MSEYLKTQNATIFSGDCLEELKALPDNSVDSIVTDPPYGLGNADPDYIMKALKMWMDGDRTHIPAGKGFMGKQWDAFVPPPAVWDECFRVLKPGGHMLVFAGTRTQDLMGLSVRMAGFEIRDSIGWIYGQGFPKSMDISKAIDKSAGAEREVIGSAGDAPDLRDVGAKSKEATGIDKLSFGQVTDAERTEILITAPATDDAKKWSGWGTALKPALEPIIVARKPLGEKTVAANVLKWGTGGINIDGSRIGSEQRTDKITENGFGANFMDDGWQPSGKTYEKTVTGRFPSNVLIQHADGCVQVGETTETTLNHNAPKGTFAGGEEDRGSDTAEYRENVSVSAIYECVDGCPVAELDKQSGIRPGGTWNTTDGARPFNNDGEPTGYESKGKDNSVGGASRYFYQVQKDDEAPTGRFPSNVIFVHSEDCKVVGTTTNKTVAGNRTATFGTQETVSGGDGSGGFDGYEYTTEVYECADGCPVKELDEQSGVLKSGSMDSITKGYDPETFNTFGKQYARRVVHKGDSGGASRFFYQAKANKKDRNEGLGEDLPEKGKVFNGKSEESAGNAPGSVEDKFTTQPARNFHPTVKPTDLMRYLIKMVTPVGGIVLDPFCGSGSTGKAAVLEDFNFIGVEITEEYLPIIKGRIEFAQEKLDKGKEWQKDQLF